MRCTESARRGQETRVAQLPSRVTFRMYSGSIDCHGWSIGRALLPAAVASSGAA
jgi:hypothetical protein